MATTTSTAPKALRVNGTASADVIYGDDLLRNTIYAGDGDDTVIGGAQDDVLVGEAGADTLYGNGGNDAMWGGGGNDALYGGEGNDSLTGDGGNDTLDGGTGADGMTGGTGNDTYVVDDGGDIVAEKLGEGIDTVQSSVGYVLGANLENLTLTGAAHINGTGNELANTIVGNAGDNLLDGGAGADTMSGGLGNDRYVLDNVGDVASERAGEGSDTVLAAFTYTLGANFENLTLTGTANINGTGNELDNVIVGNAGKNAIWGGSGNDVIDGGQGNDRLDGQDGRDTLIGGDGDDSFNGGADSDVLIGGAGNDVFWAGGGDDRVLGDDGNDTIFGDGGNDWIRGGRGDDIMVGGASNGLSAKGANTFAWERADVVNGDGSSAGRDRITDFGAGDKLDLRAVADHSLSTNAADLVRLTDTASGTLVSVDVGGGRFVDVVTLDNVHGATIDALWLLV